MRPLQFGVREFSPGCQFARAAGLECLWRDCPSTQSLADSHSSHVTDTIELTRLTGTGHRKNSLQQYGPGQSLGILRLRASDPRRR